MHKTRDFSQRRKRPEKFRLGHLTEQEFTALHTRNAVLAALDNYEYQRCSRCGGRDVHDQGGMFYSNHLCYDCGDWTWGS